MTLGAIAAATGGAAFGDNQVAYLADLGGPLALVVLLAVIAGKLTGNTLSSYGGYMSVAAIVSGLTGHNRLAPAARIGYICLVSAVSLGIALAATSNFLAAFTDFLLFLLYFLTPYSAINLVDFYLVRREQYDIEALFAPTGRYRGVHTPAFVAYIAAVLAQIPFMHSTLYVGPMARLLGGAEITWVVGLVVGAVLYYLLTPALRREYATVDLTKETR